MVEDLARDHLDPIDDCQRQGAEQICSSLCHASEHMCVAHKFQLDLYVRYAHIYQTMFSGAGYDRERDVPVGSRPG
jgi:hypothetical protein